MMFLFTWGIVISKMAKELESILKSIGNFGKDFDVFRCRVGDTDFMELIERLGVMLSSRMEFENQNYLDRLKEIDDDKSMNDERKRCNKELSERFYRIISLTSNINYPPTLGYQLEKFLEENHSNGKNHMLGLPFQIADPHVHVYPTMVELLKNSKDPVTIVRFDAHHDCHEKKKKKVSSGSYMSHILFSSIRNKINRVITASGERISSGLFEDLRDREEEEKFGKNCKVLRFNDIAHYLINILDLPVIEEPSILDIDIDGCEYAWGEARYGGHCLARPSLSCLEYDNHENVIVHPEIAARILRDRVKNPEMIFVALERVYRNRLFWLKEEFDFLETLGK